MLRRSLILLLMLLATAGRAMASSAPYGGVLRVVSPSGPYTSIAAALEDASPGDTLEVRGGWYPALVVNKSVTLKGVDWPVIDGGDKGTVVMLNAPGISFSGFEVRGSGTEPDQDHGGITLTAADIAVENNRLTDVLFGVFVSRADRALVRGNDITSKVEYDEGRKGDGIRLWYSLNVRVESNHVHGARDVVMWYSSHVTVIGNTFEDGRYGIHLMYCDDADIEHNQIRRNSVGIYAMYSNGVTLADNDLRGQRGPSGYALGFKDADRVTVAGNLLADNRAGVFLDGTPFSPQGYGRFEKNILAFNDVGVILLTAVRGNTFNGNTFWENGEQMAVQGGGQPGANLWQGNYWSDYTGFDADGNGIGDLSYRSERAFENLNDREPLLRALSYSPAVQTLELASEAFPIFKPEPKLIDAAPLMSPAAIPTSFQSAPGPAAPMALLGIVLLATAGLAALSLLSGQAVAARLPVHGGRSVQSRKLMPPITSSSPAVHVSGLGKQYGRLQALDRVDFDVMPGQSMALWGANGAGKTTLIKAILGLIEYQGHISIYGNDVRRDGKATRRLIGYVPQEAAFYDMTVTATMQFYARLKGASASRIPELLDRLGLTEHAAKTVPALSGGLKQRLALAVALLADPPVLLLDEPTANLDVSARRDYLALLTTLRRENKTLLFASHRLEEVEILADNVLVLQSGRVLERLNSGEVRRGLAPQVELTLWISDVERVRALACVQAEGFNAHLNGRGTVVVQVESSQKLRPLTALAEQGITVLDFEMERGHLWN